jgi:hypothetical protein
MKPPNSVRARDRGPVALPGTGGALFARPCTYAALGRSKPLTIAVFRDQARPNAGADGSVEGDELSVMQKRG